MPEDEKPAKKLQKLTAKEEKFCQEYTLCLNASEAARKAKYPVKNARYFGYQLLSKLHVQARVKELLETHGMTAEEVKKLIADMAKGNLADYMTTRKVVVVPRIEKKLSKLIEELKEEIEFEDQVLMFSDWTDKEIERHHVQQKFRANMLVRYELELQKSPRAKRIVSGPEEFQEITELDVAKVVADKNAGGRIKSFQNSPTMGVKIELYAADAALSKFASIHGLDAPTKLSNPDGSPLNNVPTSIVFNVVQPLEN